VQEYYETKFDYQNRNEDTILIFTLFYDKFSVMNRKNVGKILGIVGMIIFGKGQVDSITNPIMENANNQLASFGAMDKPDLAVTAFSEVAIPQPQVRLVVGSFVSSAVTQFSTGISVGLMPAIVNTDSLAS